MCHCQVQLAHWPCRHWVGLLVLASSVYFLAHVRVAHAAHVAPPLPQNPRAGQHLTARQPPGSLSSFRPQRSSSWVPRKARWRTAVLPWPARPPSCALQHPPHSSKASHGAGSSHMMPPTMPPLLPPSAGSCLALPGSSSSPPLPLLPGRSFTGRRRSADRNAGPLGGQHHAGGVCRCHCRRPLRHAAGVFVLCGRGGRTAEQRTGAA